MACCGPFHPTRCPGVSGGSGHRVGTWLQRESLSQPRPDSGAKIPFQGKFQRGNLEGFWAPIRVKFGSNLTKFGPNWETKKFPNNHQWAMQSNGGGPNQSPSANAKLNANVFTQTTQRSTCRGGGGQPPPSKPTKDPNLEMGWQLPSSCLTPLCA
jgi:hypothetical protein